MFERLETIALLECVEAKSCSRVIGEAVLCTVINVVEQGVTIACSLKDPLDIRLLSFNANRVSTTLGCPQKQQASVKLCCWKTTNFYVFFFLLLVINMHDASVK